MINSFIFAPHLFLRVVLISALVLWATLAHPQGLTSKTFETHNTLDVALIDLDLTGTPEIVTTGEIGSTRVQFHNEDRSGYIVDITRTVSLPELKGSGTWLAAGDLDRDGDTDLVSCGSKVSAKGPTCVILFNCAKDGKVFDLTCGPSGISLPVTVPSPRPILFDFDRDGDLDLLLFTSGRSPQSIALRNNLEKDVPAFVKLPEALPQIGRIDDAAILDTGDRDREIYFTRVGSPGILLRFNGVTDKFQTVNHNRGLNSPDQGGKVGVGDFDLDGFEDVAILAKSKFRIFAGREQGTFLDITHTVASLASFRSTASQILVEDIDRNGAADMLLVPRDRENAVLLRNLTMPSALGVAPAFQPSVVNITTPFTMSRAHILKASSGCDYDVRIVFGSRYKTKPSVLTFRKSPVGAKTVKATPGSAETRATIENGCAEGSDGPDRLIGHRKGSILKGLGGDDVLIAQAGVTIMRGGLGKDRFESAGLSIIQLPRDEVVSGEVIDCGIATEVIIDSPMTKDEFTALGVEFQQCFRDDICEDPEHHEPGDDHDSHDDCHPAPARARIMNLGLAAGTQAIEFARELGLVSGSGIGYGTCSNNTQCYAIGLDVCRTANGSVATTSNRGKCYPSSFDGFEGPIPEWCYDPYWARYRYEELKALNFDLGRRLVVPIIFWLPRSAGLDDNQQCALGDPSPKTVAAWHDSVVATMNSAMALFGKWGITFDYQFRTFTVASDSDWVTDKETDRCRIDLEPGGNEPNSVGKLIQANPTKYRLGEINIYLSDAAGISWSSSAEIAGKTYKFLQLSGSAGPFGHEMGHGLGLPHPYDKNVSASGIDPEDSESRNSWLMRAFPDEATDRLHVCSANNDCTGVDAEAGVCRKAPGQALGFCQNLKKDCALDGDHICDTPWDSFPCFRHVGNNLGASCDTSGDCQDESSVRGTAYLTRCSAQNVCVKVECTQNADCDSGSWCAGGTCVIWKSGTNSCCDLSTDKESGFVHNACYERRPNGTVQAAPGVGSSTTWPYPHNLMAYHKPSGIPRTTTFGQRDQSVCVTAIRKDLGGGLIRTPHAPNVVPKPCSLRPGDSVFSYGHAGQTRKIPHAACASGVCQLTSFGNLTSAVCAESTCTDGVIGAGETSIDCGGVCPDDCPTTRDSGPSTSQCDTAKDCLSGSCVFGTCHPTCEDGIKNGSELDVDAGGVSYDPTCAKQGVNEICRYDNDCAGGATRCSGEGNCVLSVDCPINDDAVACDSNTDCVNNGECVAVEQQCALGGCFSDSQCPSGFCQLPEGRCICESDNQCPGAGNSCEAIRSICLDQCVDGRCLSTCELGEAGGN